jgi:F-type H+-transporting ATPase subunit c
MSKVSTYVSAVLCLLVFVAFASAQATVPTNVTLAGKGVGAGIGIALSIVGAGWGFGRIGAAALESMARQPDKAGEIQTAMIIIAALLEGATLLALILCVVIGTSGGF